MQNVHIRLWIGSGSRLDLGWVDCNYSTNYSTSVSFRMYMYISLGSRSPPFRARLNYAHAYAANIRRCGKHSKNVLRMFAAYACA